MIHKEYVINSTGMVEILWTIFFTVSKVAKILVECLQCGMCIAFTTFWNAPA